jgi:ribonucleoside-diphosphate reductase beta chain
MDQMRNGIEHANFFEDRATEYPEPSTRGTWEEALS